MSLTTEITRRRTFAIISHPDAGKTTLTEKLLLFGGAIHVAGAVKSKKIKKTATSDWITKSISLTRLVTKTLPRTLTAPSLPSTALSSWSMSPRVLRPRRGN